MIMIILSHFKAQILSSFFYSGGVLLVFLFFFYPGCIFTHQFGSSLPGQTLPLSASVCLGKKVIAAHSLSHLSPLLRRSSSDTSSLFVFAKPVF